MIDLKVTVYSQIEEKLPNRWFRKKSTRLIDVEDQVRFVINDPACILYIKEDAEDPSRCFLYLTDIGWVLADKNIEEILKFKNARGDKAGFYGNKDRS
jgi:hypothetical protein